MKRLTVAELIAQLQALQQPDMLVCLQGCDCTGPAGGAVIEKGLGEGELGTEASKAVLILRAD